MQKELCSLLLLVSIPKALIHFALTTFCITCPTGFSFNEVVVSGGEWRLKLITELLLMATLKIICSILFPLRCSYIIQGLPIKQYFIFCIVYSLAVCVNELQVCSEQLSSHFLWLSRFCRKRASLVNPLLDCTLIFYCTFCFTPPTQNALLSLGLQKHFWILNGFAKNKGRSFYYTQEWLLFKGGN